ncbi:MAG: PhzF family phenazine biosynthesis protein [Rhodospirillum sp.]|nr:PhzF family phenazine biosynthesis protein [Rhodospirillum sp.]MCF8489830.1 PhzF family phenazine biosynthesis protein [Rhodospirillum sp.]MCF8499675.1 PhzF family phenazine biosynthesis protein [Rhodospirillum sp.]
MEPEVLRLAAFSDGGEGGNPAGVCLGNTLPSVETMARVAREVGYSETVFAARDGDAWRTRYFSPESEVPFCGHATIALGATLAMRLGDGVFTLNLNNAVITVEGHHQDSDLSAALMSPPTWSQSLAPGVLSDYLSLFGYGEADLDSRLPPARIHGGADHLILALSSRARLAAMRYDLDKGRRLMTRDGLITILLVQAEADQMFHTRGPFASGGVYEDPATGAATAALGGYLRDLGWPHGGVIDVVQGEDMGMRSRLRAEIPPQSGASIRVSGAARLI